jgi:hypothetical protein
MNPRSPTARGGREPLLALTATIDPRGMSFTARADANVRLADYKWALNRWLSERGVRRLVFCENSMSDLTPLRDLVLRKNRLDKTVVFHSFDGNRYPTHRGKGFGELNILRHIVANLSADVDVYLIKVTGRYFVRNVTSLTQVLNRTPSIDVACNISSDGSIADSRIFTATVDFLRSYLLPLQDSVDDTAGRFLEHALADAVRNAMKAGLVWSPLPKELSVQGVSGTSNRPHGQSRPVAWRLAARVLRSMGLQH